MSPLTSLYAALIQNKKNVLSNEVLKDIIGMLNLEELEKLRKKLDQHLEDK